MILYAFITFNTCNRLFIFLTIFRVQRASVPLTTNPNSANIADTTLNLQAAIKNMHTNAVFYFLIPNTFDALLVSSSPPDITAFVASWKSIEDSLEVSMLINGE